MAHNTFNQFGGGQNGGGTLDPNELSMGGEYLNNGSNAFSSGSGHFGDDELLDGLGSPTNDYPGMSDVNMGFAQGGMYSSHANSGLQLDPAHMSGYSNTPEGDPIQSPYVHSFSNNQFNRMHQPMGTSLQSPISYSGSPLAGSDLNPDDPNYLKARPRMPQTMQRKGSNTRSPMTAKSAMHPMSMGSQESGFGAQPVRAPAMHEKSPSGQWNYTPANSMTHSYNSGFPSPLGSGLVQINEVMRTAGTSMPAKLGAPNAVSSQEMKRKRRRESHNLVERRRRDNINERIQDLSRLVPTHRLEDEKIRKMIQNGTPISPSLTGVSNPGQATSGLAGPGARRAAGGTAGNITTGLPVEDKDKGPNKGDILNGAVSWTRDLMWMLHLKLQQQEELMNIIVELGGNYPIELTDDEKRMQTELIEAIGKNESGSFSYTRTAGSGLRVPQHTDYRGDPLSGSAADASGSPGSGAMGADPSAEFWNDPDEDGSANASINFKEEDEYDMDLTN